MSSLPEDQRGAKISTNAQTDCSSEETMARIRVTIEAKKSKRGKPMEVGEEFGADVVAQLLTASLSRFLSLSLLPIKL